MLTLMNNVEKDAATRTNTGKTEKETRPNQPARDQPARDQPAREPSPPPSPVRPTLTKIYNTDPLLSVPFILILLGIIGKFGLFPANLGILGIVDGISLFSYIIVKLNADYR